MSDPALPFSPAAERNRAPILEVLAAALPAEARVLEVASGTGQHAEHFARSMPRWHWHPTEAEASALPAIASRCAELANVAPPRRLDVLGDWPDEIGPVDAVYVANLLHIAPWACCEALMGGAARLLAPGGQLLIYGPFVIDEVPTAASNLAFDADLRARHPAWGLRRLADVVAQAEGAGLAFEQRVPMPANNQILRLRKPPPADAAA